MPELIVNTKAKRDEVVVAFNSSDEEWATSADRAPVFSTSSVVPNPAYSAEATYAEHEQAPAKTIERPVMHTMPAKPNAGLALEYLRMARRSTADEAMSWLIETAVGPDGYDALVDELSKVGEQGPAVLEGIVRKIQTIAMGGLDGPKG